MSRRQVLPLFALCAAALVGIVGWLTLTVRRLDEAERRGRREAAREEKVRLALWRMESQLAPIVARESVQPPEAYRPTAAPPSSPYVRLRFQWDDAGRASAPAVGASIDRATVEARLSSEWVVVQPAAPPPASAPSPPEALRQKEALRQVEAKQAEALQRIQTQAKGDAQELSKLEFQARAATNAANVAPPTLGPTVRPAAAAEEVRLGRLQPLWVGEELVLARRVRIGSRELVQASWLDWPALERWLLAGVADLLPGARLVPVAADAGDETRRLAALPARLLPGATAAPTEPVDSSLRLPLAVAWGLAFVALAASGALLLGLATLGERRAAFVSAVTHELRTPLTTFRMYSDMLLEGMVSSEEQRREYLTTLSREAERQSHLVENVLAYSRLERGRYAGPAEEISLGALVARVGESLAAHAAQSGMTLATSIPPEAADVRLRVDRSAVERVLFNLVDNACKYARDASDRRIHLDAEADGRAVCLTVSDHGPGIDAKEMRRLFRPFHKSARDAAQSAPGVGLGLALSRRLARALGGDLGAVRDRPQGAAFCLRLPRA